MDAIRSIKAGISPTLSRILKDAVREIQEDQARESLAQVKDKIGAAPPRRSFADALRPGRAIIAEIKERSPSQGPMRSENFEKAVAAYKKSAAVRAISVLTSRTHFGAAMTLATLRAIKEETGKPVLRKDFIISEYQIYQARAYGADAILLMANVLETEAIKRLAAVAADLGLDVLFEIHSPEELQQLSPAAGIIGINCRNFDASGLSTANFVVARFLRQWLGSKRDHSVDLERFSFVDRLPIGAIKVAESGITTENTAAVFALGFQAILVGTSLLTDVRGIEAALVEFERAVENSKGLR